MISWLLNSNKEKKKKKKQQKHNGAALLSRDHKMKILKYKAKTRA